jgi:hypothetical protein
LLVGSGKFGVGSGKFGVGRWELGVVSEKKLKIKN